MRKSALKDAGLLQWVGPFRLNKVKRVRCSFYQRRKFARVIRELAKIRR